jgi:hypothetical protein
MVGACGVAEHAALANALKTCMFEGRPAAAAQAFDTGWGAQGRPNRAAISLGPDRDVKVIRAANIKVNGHRLRQTAYAGRPTGSLPYLNS